MWHTLISRCRCRSVRFSSSSSQNATRPRQSFEGLYSLSKTEDQMLRVGCCTGVLFTMPAIGAVMFFRISRVRGARALRWWYSARNFIWWEVGRRHEYIKCSLQANFLPRPDWLVWNVLLGSWSNDLATSLPAPPQITDQAPQSTISGMPLMALLAGSSFSRVITMPIPVWQRWMDRSSWFETPLRKLVWVSTTHAS